MTWLRKIWCFLTAYPRDKLQELERNHQKELRKHKARGRKIEHDSAQAVVDNLNKCLEDQGFSPIWKLGVHPVTQDYQIVRKTELTLHTPSC